MLHLLSRSVKLSFPFWFTLNVPTALGSHFSPSSKELSRAPACIVKSKHRKAKIMAEQEKTKYFIYHGRNAFSLCCLLNFSDCVRAAEKSQAGCWNPIPLLLILFKILSIIHQGILRDKCPRKISKHSLRGCKTNNIFNEGGPDCFWHNAAILNMTCHKDSQ